MNNPEEFNKLGEQFYKSGDLQAAHKNFAIAVMLGDPNKNMGNYNMNNEKNNINCIHLYNYAFILNEWNYGFEKGVLARALKLIEIVLKNDPSYKGAEELKGDLLKEQTRTILSPGGGKTTYPFINAKLNGRTIMTNEQGVIIDEVSWVNDIVEGPTRIYHSNGQLKVEVIFKNGQQLDGLVESYNDFGTLIKKTTISSGKYNGIQTLFFDDGKVKSETRFVDDEKVGVVKEYNKEGILVIQKEIEKKEKRKFIIKDYKQIHIINDDPENYDYIDSTDLLSHFFNMKFESDSGEIIFLVCHLYVMFNDGFSQLPEYKFFSADNLNSLEYTEINFCTLNSNNEYELEKIIGKDMITFDSTDVGENLDVFIGDTLYI